MTFRINIGDIYEKRHSRKGDSTNDHRIMDLKKGT